MARDTSLTGDRSKRVSHWESAGLDTWVTLPLECSSDDSKSSSPEPVTHLKWDDPYYDIARHQIVEVAGKCALSCISFLILCNPGLEKPLMPPRKNTVCSLWFALEHVPSLVSMGWF